MCPPASFCRGSQLTIESCPDKPTAYWQSSQAKNYIVAPDLLSNLDRCGAPELSGSPWAQLPASPERIRLHGAHLGKHPSSEPKVWFLLKEGDFCIVVKVGIKLMKSLQFGGHQYRIDSTLWLLFSLLTFRGGRPWDVVSSLSSPLQRVLRLSPGFQ